MPYVVPWRAMLTLSLPRPGLPAGWLGQGCVSTSLLFSAYVQCHAMKRVVPWRAMLTLTLPRPGMV